MKNYHFIYLLKKIILLICIFLLVDYPIIVCSLGVSLNLTSAVFTFATKSYKYLFNTLIKATGDLLLCTVWVYMILFIKFFSGDMDSIVYSEE